MNRLTLFFLLASFSVAFFLRWYLLPTNLFFGPEQGRDFLAIKSIVIDRKLTLIGPKTDFAGVFHGPLYYYLAAVPFVLFRGNPLSVMGLLTLLQALTVFLVYAAGRELTGKRSVGLLSAILFTFSYGAILYSRWLTGVPLTIPLSFALLWLLARFFRGRTRTLPAVAVVAALLLQAEFINFLFVPFILLYGVFRYGRIRKTPRPLLVLSFLIFLLLATGTYVLFDLRHNFLTTRSVLGNFTDTGKSLVSWNDSLREVLTGFARATGGFLGIPIQWVSSAVLAGIALYLLARSMQKEKGEGGMLLVWLIVPPVILILFRRGTLDQLFVLTIPAVIVGAALILREIARRLGKTLAVILLVGIIVINTRQVWRNFPTNENVFFQSTQPGVRYNDQLTIIDRIYAKAGTRPFEVQSYTIPYFWQDGWTYLFWWQGREKYRGKLPVSSGGEVLFVIIQKDRSNPTFQNNWYRDTVSRWGVLVDQVTIGDYTLEEREMKGTL